MRRVATREPQQQVSAAAASSRSRRRPRRASSARTGVAFLLFVCHRGRRDNSRQVIDRARGSSRNSWRRTPRTAALIIILGPDRGAHSSSGALRELCAPVRSRVATITRPPPTTTSGRADQPQLGPTASRLTPRVAVSFVLPSTRAELGRACACLSVTASGRQFGWCSRCERVAAGRAASSVGRVQAAGAFHEVGAEFERGPRSARESVQNLVPIRSNGQMAHKVARFPRRALRWPRAGGD